jgi:hypothetical protein
VSFFRRFKDFISVTNNKFLYETQKKINKYNNDDIQIIKKEKILTLNNIKVEKIRKIHNTFERKISDIFRYIDAFLKYTNKKSNKSLKGKKLGFFNELGNKYDVENYKNEHIEIVSKTCRLFNMIYENNPHINMKIVHSKNLDKKNIDLNLRVLKSFVGESIFKLLYNYSNSIILESNGIEDIFKKMRKEIKELIGEVDKKIEEMEKFLKKNQEIIKEITKK